MTTSTGLTRRSVGIQDPRRAKGKKKIRSGCARSMLGAPRLVARTNSRNSSAGIPRTNILHNVASGGLHPPYELRRPFRRGEELPKAPKLGALWPTLAHRQERPKRTTKVMAHWPLWRRNTAPAASGTFFLVRDRWPTGGAAGSETLAERRRDLDAMFPKFNA